jgi:hypothetical protein
MKLNSTFRTISKELRLEFDQLAKEISHNQSAGEAREEALRRQLARYLPRRVGIDRGFVVDAHGGESKQIDVVIYDQTVGTVFDVGGVKYFPCETVIAVGEVKSDIRSKEKLGDALDKIRSVKRLDRSNEGKNLIISGPGVSVRGLTFNPTTKHRDQIFGFIFTSTSMTRETIIECLQSWNESTERRHWMNLFCDVSRFLISYECPERLYPSAMDATYLYCTRDSEMPDLFLLFCCILATFVDEAHVARPRYFDYAEIDRTMATYHELLPERRRPVRGNAAAEE